MRDKPGQWIVSHVINQDIVGWVGQGAIADRGKENLRSSDIGIALMRKRFFNNLTSRERPRSGRAFCAMPRRRAASRCPT